MDTIYSIGHSNQPLESFLGLVAKAGIEILADIRSQPFSRFSPQFNRKRLEDSMYAAGVLYVPMGNELGGRPRKPELYDDEGRVLYGCLAETPGFQSGIEHLLRLVTSGRAAVLCSEENPAGCHRRLLVGRVLDEFGLRMIHLRRGGNEEMEDTFGRTLQAPLGCDEDPSWHSVRPVRPARFVEWPERP